MEYSTVNNTNTLSKWVYMLRLKKATPLVMIGQNESGEYEIFSDLTLDEIKTRCERTIKAINESKKTNLKND